MFLFFPSYSLENCARCFIALRPQCKTESRSPALFTCYLFFRCRIEKESLSWAFPHHSPTHTHTHTRLSQTHLCSHTQTHIFDEWAEYILRDVVHPSRLTWSQHRGGTRLSSLYPLHLSKDKALKPCKRMQHILDSTNRDCVEWYKASMWRHGSFYLCSVPWCPPRGTQKELK